YLGALVELLHLGRSLEGCREGLRVTYGSHLVWGREARGVADDRGADAVKRRAAYYALAVDRDGLGPCDPQGVQYVPQFVVVQDVVSRVFVFRYGAGGAVIERGYNAGAAQRHHAGGDPLGGDLVVDVEEARLVPGVGALYRAQL